MRIFRSILAVAVLLIVASGCGGNKRVNLDPGKPNAIAVLTLDGNLPGRTLDQERELDIVMRWMDRDIIRNMKRSGFNAVLLKDPKDYKQEMGMLLVVDVADFNPGSRAARAFVGYGAGAASLDLTYQLKNDRGETLLDWKDGVGSSKGGTYCAQTLNRKVLERLAVYLNGK